VVLFLFLLVLACDEISSFAVFLSSCSVMMSSFSVFFSSCSVLLFFLSWPEMRYLVCLFFSLLFVFLSSCSVFISSLFVFLSSCSSAYLLYLCFYFLVLC